MTLKELIAEHGFGKKFICTEMEIPITFIPYAYSTKESEKIIGEDSTGGGWAWKKTSGGWSLYTEPKKKVKKWLWASRYIGILKHIEKGWFQNNTFSENAPTMDLYPDPENFEHIKLPWSEIEVDE
jgi:hypothetical protein